MATVVNEAWHDRREALDADGFGAYAEIPYIVSEATDETAALVAVHESAPLAWNDLDRETPFCEIDRRIGETTWRIIARYRGLDTSLTEPEYQFDTGGGSEHITQALATRASYAPSGVTAPDMKGAIGWDGEQVQGADIVKASFTFSETHYLTADVVTNNYRAALARKTGMYNNDSFRAYDPGEVLLLRAHGSRRGRAVDDPWAITFEFAVQPNRTNIEIGDITVTEKLGWDYLWVRYKQTVDPSTGLLVSEPAYVYVNKVYYGTDFTSLGIGN